MSTYVMSDLHGQEKTFKKMLREIEFNPDKDFLYILGDVIDRGEDPIKLLLYIMHNKSMKMIRGNHELLMTDFYTKGGYSQWDLYNVWMHNGARPTIIQMGRYAESTQKAIVRYLCSLPTQIELNMNDTDFILVHSLPDPNMFENNPMERFEFGAHYSSDIEFQVWCRSAVGEEDPAFENKVIIHGHTPTMNHLITVEPDTPYGKWINIDCGCGHKGGNLGCIRLDDMKEFYVPRD